MNTVIKVRSIGEKSPNFDLETCDLPLEVFSYARNYLLRDNKIHTFNGEQIITSSASAPVNSGHIRFVQKSPTELFYLVAGSSSVKVFDLLNWTDISIAAGYPVVSNFERFWSSCNLGPITVLTNYNTFPQYWPAINVSQMLLDLPFSSTQTWRQKNFKCKIIRSHLNFLFALGLQEGSTEYPNAYRWSHPADIGSIPFSWDELDLSTIASKEFIDDEYIIDGCSMRNEFAIYTNRGIHILTYRANSETPFVRRKLSTTQNLLTSECVVEVLGANYFLSNSDILICDGNNTRSILDKRFKNFLKQSLSQTNFDNCYATVNSNTKEVWFFIVQFDNVHPNIAIVINYVDYNVSIRDILPNRSHACFGIVQDPGAPTAFWNSENILEWESNAEQWNDNLATPFDYRIINCATSGQLETPEPLSNFVYVNNLNTVLEKTNFDIDNTTEIKTIVQFTPKLSSIGNVLVEVGGHDFLDSPIRWKPAVQFNPLVDRKVDVRSTGNYHAWRISSVGTQQFSLYGFDIVYEVAGKRIGGFIPAVVR